MNAKVVIVVEGGVVQTVFGPEGTAIEVIDLDDAEADGTSEDAEAKINAHAKKLTELY